MDEVLYLLKEFIRDADMSYTISEQLIMLLVLVVGLLIAPLILIGLDFWAGIRKAKLRKERIRSDKMQRTVQKLSRYYNAILAMLLLDAIQIGLFVFLHIFNSWDLYTFPAFTLIAVLFVASIEIKSIWEPANAKEGREMKEVTELAKAIAEHKSDPKEIAEAIAGYLKDRS